MNLQEAVTGTDNPRDLLLAAGVQAFRLQAGYVASVMDTAQRDFSFLITSRGKVAFSVRECTVFRLSPEFWAEVVFQVDDMKIRYPNALVFNDFVVFCWSDAMEISYEWCQLEVTRECLIELWESNEP